MNGHQAVLLHEALAALNVCPDGYYVDATFGRGGHSAAILDRLSGRGRLLALDRDPEAARFAHEHFAREHCSERDDGGTSGEQRFQFIQTPFSGLLDAVGSLGWRGRVAGLLLDLGVSSPQLDDPRRGFSFRHDGPLDMRMDPATGVSAAQWLAGVSLDELDEVLKRLGEERFHKRIARAVIEARAAAPVVTTRRLADIVAGAIPAAAKPTRSTGGKRPPPTPGHPQFPSHPHRRQPRAGRTRRGVGPGVGGAGGPRPPGGHQFPFFRRPHGQAVHAPPRPRRRSAAGFTGPGRRRAAAAAAGRQGATRRRRRTGGQPARAQRRAAGGGAVIVT